MTFVGAVREVESVPEAFAALVAERAPRSIALSGGSTAEEGYAALARRAVDWSDVEVYIGDERFVPVTHADSNEGMIRRTLFSDVSPRILHSMATAGPTPDSAANVYDALVRTRSPIDLIHLGLGPDGHTASLFPGSSTLDVTDHYVTTAGDESLPASRVRADEIIWLVDSAALS